jgi:tripeptidyl-peptidase-1
MRFGLVQQNLFFHGLEEMLMSVSHPESPKYAQLEHFTPMEVVDTFAPSQETIFALP